MTIERSTAEIEEIMRKYNAKMRKCYDKDEAFRKKMALRMRVLANIEATRNYDPSNQANKVWSMHFVKSHPRYPNSEQEETYEMCVPFIEYPTYSRAPIIDFPDLIKKTRGEYEHDLYHRINEIENRLKDKLEDNPDNSFARDDYSLEIEPFQKQLAEHLATPYGDRVRGWKNEL